MIIMALNNNTTTKVNIMTTKHFDAYQYDVVAIHPVTLRKTTFRNVSAEYINIDDPLLGITFSFNNFYNTVPVISLVEIAQDVIDAQRAYFDKYGTACE